MRAGPLIALTLVGLAIAALGVLDPGGGASRPDATTAGAEPRSRAGSESARERRSRVKLGESARGRPIRAIGVDGEGERPAVLVVGCIHGTECAGIEVARSLRRHARRAGERIVVVPSLNPDGRFRGTRTSARGVDLNRNFDADWRPIGAPGDPQHSGTRPFSEPETRVARRLIVRLRPDVTIWFHQQAEPLVRAWGPSVPAARVYARLAETPFHRLPWIEGTAPNWQNARFPESSSFVVELPLGEAAESAVARHVRAITRLARSLEEARG